MRVIIIDNQDSFTYNLAHYTQQFVHSVDVFRVNKIEIKELYSYDKIILSPGPGLPNEHPFLRDIIHEFHASKSMLGICLGHQALAEYFKATLENLSVVKHGVTSKIHQNQNCSIFNDIPVSFQIGHYHSWIVSENKFPECLEITSTNQDGIITSFKHKKFDVKGLQFHPESILTEYGLQLIKNWVIN